MKTKLIIPLIAATLLAATASSAQSLTLRVEPGVAFALTDPQADRFKNPGGALAVKPELTINYLSVGPSFQFLGYRSDVPGVDSGSAVSYGGFMRIKRPHNEKNTDRGLAAFSPWADIDFKFVRTGELDRFGTAVAAGVQFPTSDDRILWMGPFVRYDLTHNEDGKPGINTNSAKTLILGVSFEFGVPAKRKQDKEEVAQQKPQETPKQEEPKVEPQPLPQVPPPATVEVLVSHICFDFDSAELRSTEDQKLSAVLTHLTQYTDAHITVEGHTSSEGQLAYNNKLSQRRAESVVKWLTAHGVDAKRMTAKGYGPTKPIADNSTDQGRQLNRRVEFDIRIVVQPSK